VTISAVTSPYLSMVALCGLHNKQKDKAVLQSVHRRAVRWINSKYDPCTYQLAKGSDIYLEEVKWPTLELRRKKSTSSK